MAVGMAGCLPLARLPFLLHGHCDFLFRVFSFGLFLKWVFGGILWLLLLLSWLCISRAEEYAGNDFRSVFVSVFSWVSLEGPQIRFWT